MEKYANSKERKALSSFIHQNLIKMTVQTQPKSTKEKKNFRVVYQVGQAIFRQCQNTGREWTMQFICMLELKNQTVVHYNGKERFIRQATTVDAFHGMNNQMNDLYIPSTNM